MCLCMIFLNCLAEIKFLVEHCSLCTPSLVTFTLPSISNMFKVKCRDTFSSYTLLHLANKKDWRTTLILLFIWVVLCRHHPIVATDAEHGRPYVFADALAVELRVIFHMEVCITVKLSVKLCFGEHEENYLAPSRPETWSNFVSAHAPVSPQLK